MCWLPRRSNHSRFCWKSEADFAIYSPFSIAANYYGKKLSLSWASTRSSSRAVSSGGGSSWRKKQRGYFSANRGLRICLENLNTWKSTYKTPCTGQKAHNFFLKNTEKSRRELTMGSQPEMNSKSQERPEEEINEEFKQLSQPAASSQSAPLSQTEVR